MVRLTKRPENHIVTIDAARGIFAVGVMLYHLLFFNGIVQVERVAYYAVYGFFVISGFALYVTYRDRLTDVADLRSYFIKRFFRIAPLYFTVLAVRLCIPPVPDDLLYRLLLNFSLTFGLANPGSTALNGGGWSIGIEMVFYVFFPVILIMCRGSLARLAGFAALASVVAVLFINITLEGNRGGMTSELWERYTQPVAFFGYFAFGLLFGAVYVRYPWLKGQAYSFALLVLGALPFFLVRAETDLQLLTGTKGVMLAAGTVLIVAGATFLPEPRGRLRDLAAWLGAMSYPVYLIHLLVTTAMREWFPLGWINVATAIAMTFLLSMCVRRYIEMPFRELGRTIAKRDALKTP
jgi:peptidoglycan/LPS O-acetylase OafA/YrhL